MIGCVCGAARTGGAAGLVVLVLAAPRPADAQRPGEDPSSTAEVVTLEEAVERALLHSPALAQASGAVENAEWTERAAWGAFLPTLSASSGASLSSTERFNPQTNTVVSGSNDSYSGGLSASLDVFTAGRRGAELRRARAETAARDAALVEQRFAVTRSAKAAFFEVLRAEELLRVAAARVRRADEALQGAQRRLEVGSATRSDVLRAQLERANARQAELEAESQRRVATFALGRLVGSDGPVGARIEAPLEPRPLALSDAELLDLVLSRAPAVRSAEAAVRSADAGARAAVTQYFPSLRASAGLDWFNQDARLDGGRTSWSLRLGVSYPLFNGFQRESAVQRAQVDADVAAVTLEDARRSARAELERLLAALRLAEERIALTEEAVLVAEEDLRVQQERYRLGASTIIDQITSQENLVTAETNLVGARYDYQLARAELEALVGREL